jgi:hypothetical protein
VIKKTLAVFFGIWIGVGLIFWFWVGDSLKCDVYSGLNGTSTYWYSENLDFSSTDRVIISSLIGLIASTVILLIRWLLCYAWRRLNPSEKILKKSG